MITRHWLLLSILLLGFFLRIGTINYAIGYRENPDILRWKDRARIAYLHSYADTYKTDYLSFGTYPNNMPPGGQYIISGIYWIWLQSGKFLAHIGIPPGSNEWVNGPFLTLLLRIPSFIADICIAILIYATVKQLGKSEKTAVFSSALFFLNPITLFNSAYMGQRDSINNIFFLLSVWALVKRRYQLLAFGLALSFLVKFSLIFTIPVFAYVMYKQTKSIKKIVMVGITGIIATLVGVLPVSPTPLSWYLGYFLKNVSGEMPNLTAFAFNGWWALFRPRILLGSPLSTFSASEITLQATPFVDEYWIGVKVSTWAIAIFVLCCLPIFLQLFRLKKIEHRHIFLTLGVVAMLGFLWLPKMHERYLYPIFPLIALAIGVGLPFVGEFILLSILNFINLAIVWHPTPLYSWVYFLFNSQNVQWATSICTVIVCMVLYIKAMRFLRES